MFAVSLSIDMYETKIINRKKSFKVRENSLQDRDNFLRNKTLKMKFTNSFYSHSNIFLPDQATWGSF